MTYVIALGSFTHVVAGSVDTFYLVARGGLTWGDYLGRFMLPTLFGNVIGGVALVAVLNHAQVTAGSSEGGLTPGVLARNSGPRWNGGLGISL